MKRALAALCLAFFLLSACGPLPRPFGRDDGESGNKLATGIFFEGVEVQPLSGTTLPMSKLIAKAIIERLEKEYEIPAAYEGLDRSEFVLIGHVADGGRDVQNAAGHGNAKVTIEWQLLRRDGEVIDAFADRIDASRLEWEYGAAPMLRKIGDETGTRVAKLVLGDRYGTQGQDRLLGRKGVYIEEVEGAPGDGNAALRRAMLVALGGGGLRIVNDPQKAVFTLDGNVEMGEPDDGAQSIRILWLVRDIDGNIVGRADQSNVVAAGSLNGRWGRTAAFVAAAATEGIITVVERNDPTRLRGPNLGAPRPPRTIPEASPPEPALPRVPGRAPPPPS